MHKNDNYKTVVDAEQKVKDEIGDKMYYMLGVTQRAQMVQDKLPTKPLYCLAKVKEILNAGR